MVVAEQLRQELPFRNENPNQEGIRTDPETYFSRLSVSEKMRSDSGGAYVVSCCRTMEGGALLLSGVIRIVS